MKTNDFPGWDSVKGVRLSENELDRDFRAVMGKARAMEAPRRSLFRSSNVFFAYACLAVLLLIAGFAAYSAFRPQKTVIAENLEYSASKGEIKEVTLPDKSKVVLNSGSVLICPAQFGVTRSVYLMGEAIFDVTASDANPFTVKTSDIQLRVHGTRFNVKAYFDDPDVKTTLCRGQVEVWPAGRSDRSIELEPGQTLTYDKSGGSMVVSRGYASEATSWEDGDLCFRSESIHGVIRILERHFNVNIYLTTDKYDDAVITASFIHSETLEDLLKAIAAVIPGMKYTIEGDKVYLK